jgi:hypothetical protein
MGHPLRIEKQRVSYTNPTDAFMQHQIEVASVHWPRKDLSKGKAKDVGKPKIQFNRQTAGHPTKTHRVAPKKKFTA